MKQTVRFFIDDINTNQFENQSVQKDAFNEKIQNITETDFQWIEKYKKIQASKIKSNIIIAQSITKKQF
jgi:hypothetical protein